MQRGNVEVGTAYHPCSVMTCAAVVTPADAGTESVTPVMRIEQTSIRGTTTIGPTTWRYLDKLGRTIRAEAQSFDGPARVRRDTRYDARGRVRRASQPYYSGGTAHYTAYAYDARGRVLSETRPDGGVTTMAYVVDSANANQIRATATEEVYKPGSSTAAATRETVSLYNVMGELVSRTEGHGTADAAKTGIAYNGAGQPTTHTADGSVAATFDYDSAGFRESVTSPNFGTVTSTYTKFGELHARADGKGTTTWTYDTLGRPTKRKDPGGVAEWRYDPMYADGALKQRCYEQGANAARCADLSAPDFKQELAYGPKARLSTSTTTIEERGGTSYHHAYNYDKHGRIDTIDYPSELTVRHGYNERGYRDTLTNAATGATLEERAAMDAHGNVTEVTYGNGVTTTRAFDPKTGRARDIDTVARGGTKIQDNAYVWRSDGLLESRASHIGGNNAKLETFAYDPLGRLATATTKLGDVTRRTLSQTYDDKGNLKTKTSSVGADIGTTVSAYHYDDAAKPNRLSRATIGGKDHTFSHDADGNIKKYDCTSPTCGDDKYIEWNGRNLPHRITVGGSRADDTPTSRDEFAYGPDGARFHRETTYTDANDDLQTEHTYYVGSFEELLPRSGAAHASIEQTRVTDAVRHVRTTTVTTDDEGNETGREQDDYVEYLHKDHLGSVEGATDEAGARTRTLAHDPFGERRKADWTAALTDAERAALAGSSDPRTRGHTGHEHLDRTGFIHRGGRVYDPTLGRFLSPDPLVGNPGSAQAWNGYSYVSNSPMSFVDPSGLSQAPGAGGCDLVGVMCGAAGGGFGLASVVSTHRFQWVDIFFSVSSLITLDWGSGSGVIYNYSGESDPYFGGWGWGSFDAFAGVSYGYSYWSGSVQVTGQLALDGFPRIASRPLDAEPTEHIESTQQTVKQGPGKWMIIDADKIKLKNFIRLPVLYIFNIGEPRKEEKLGKDFETGIRDVTQEWVPLNPSEVERMEDQGQTSVERPYGETKTTRQEWAEGPDPWRESGKSYQWHPGIPKVEYELKGLPKK